MYNVNIKFQIWKTVLKIQSVISKNWSIPLAGSANKSLPINYMLYLELQGIVSARVTLLFLFALCHTQLFIFSLIMPTGKFRDAKYLACKFSLNFEFEHTLLEVRVNLYPSGKMIGIL